MTKTSFDGKLSMLSAFVATTTNRYVTRLSKLLAVIAFVLLGAVQLMV